MDTQGSSDLGKKAWTANSKVGGDSLCSEQTYRNRGGPNDPKLLTSNYSLSSFALFHSNPHKHKGMSAFPLLGGFCSHWDRNKGESDP